MGNQHSGSHASFKPRKNVHWKSAGRPAVPGKPEIIPIASEDEPNAVTLRWAASGHDGGAALQGYQVECNRVGAPAWLRTAPPLVSRPELLLTGLDPPHRYQFRVAAVNAVGRSDYSELSDVLTVAADRASSEPPRFLRHLEDTTALENDKTEFRVTFAGMPAPTIAWFKDDYEIFSSRRTAITSDEGSSVLVFHQTLASDEGEIKCTATNRAGHAVSRARLSLEAAPKLRYPRQYEDGLLFEINETIFLKMTIVGKPSPSVEWRHNGQPLISGERVEITNTGKFAMLKIQAARRSDRGEYQVAARNSIGEDSAAFLVTVTAPPEPPRRVSVARQVDKSVTLAWEPPDDDGGCRIGNYVVEYYRTGWNVWLKATTSRKPSATLFDLIEGSEYRFRVKAESPYGMSAPSEESAPVRVPGRAVDMDFLAVEARIISQELEEAPEPRVSPAPRRKRPQAAPSTPDSAPSTDYKRPRASSTPPGRADPNEFMLILYPDSKATDKTEISEKRSSFQLDLEEALSPPPLSLSAPELSARMAGAEPRQLRHAVSSSELLHERAMARFYNAVALQERLQQTPTPRPAKRPDYIPQAQPEQPTQPVQTSRQPTPPRTPNTFKRPDIFIKTDSIEDREYKYASQDSEASDSKWHHSSFEEDYTASTASTDEYSDEGSLDGELGRNHYSSEQDTYNPRDKVARTSSSLDEALEEEEEESEKEIVKPLPLPDPNFVPKPILKRRELNESLEKAATDKGKINSAFTQKTVEKPIQKETPKKPEKMNLFKKFTKMPVQKPFPFPKILKKHNEKPESDEKPMMNNKLDAAHTNATKKVEKIDERLSDEGRTVIDYYGSIVKEYGSQKRPSTPLYLNTEDLKTMAEKQALEKKQELAVEQKKIVKSKKTANKTTKSKTKTDLNNTKVPNSVDSKPKAKERVATKTKLEKKTKLNSNNVAQDTDARPAKKGTQQIVVTTSERATVVTINYEELEQRAKAKVRSAIDYAVDSCLLLLAFWLYLFRDERLAVPLLALLAYRQLAGLPRWAASHAPSWLKRKAS